MDEMLRLRLFGGGAGSGFDLSALIAFDERGAQGPRDAGARDSPLDG